jgi:hypothetical protein
VTVRDAQNCINSKTIVLTDESDLELFFEPTHVTKFCDVLGSINLIVEGGTPDYSVAWSNGSNEFNLRELSTGMYIATVTDGNGCERIDSVSVNQNFPIRVNGQEIQNASGAGVNDGEVRIAVSGGEGPLMYSWDNGGDTNEIRDLAGGSYVVTISDQFGCSRVDTFTVDIASGVFERPNFGLLTLSPVPASNQLTINFSSIPHKGSTVLVEIVSIDGKLINSLTVDLIERKHVIDITAYPAGTYFIKATVGNNVYVDKFMKQ